MSNHTAVEIFLSRLFKCAGTVSTTYYNTRLVKTPENAADIELLKQKASGIEQELLALIGRDAEVFEPLSRAYGLPKETAEEQAYKAQIMEAALKEACSVPLSIMERCCEAIALIDEFAQKGTAIAISDAGCGAACCRAAAFHDRVCRHDRLQQNAAWRGSPVWGHLARPGGRRTGIPDGRD